jgi:hypothetical protein
MSSSDERIAALEREVAALRRGVVLSYVETHGVNFAANVDFRRLHSLVAADVARIAEEWEAE